MSIIIEGNVGVKSPFTIGERLMAMLGDPGPRTRTPDSIGPVVDGLNGRVHAKFRFWFPTCLSPRLATHPEAPHTQSQAVWNQTPTSFIERDPKNTITNHGDNYFSGDITPLDTRANELELKIRSSLKDTG